MIQECEERAREQDAKAGEEKRYQCLSNQQKKENHNSNVSQETKMSGAKSREPKKKSLIKRENILKQSKEAPTPHQNR
ncbi:hypothetical protein [Companilactobacillus furfuricola]|uniref:hypothetical protein n=1 Tax=Companilactobacillus furfuricola TaxID=1462575 RepID=UPI0013DE08AE|nr:hypothetical protein [Companilactobacillus furfuricola]